MKKQLVHIKGTKDGLVLQLDDQCAYADLLEELKKKISEGGIDGKVDVQLHLGFRHILKEQRKNLVDTVQSSGKMHVTNIISNVVAIDDCNEKLLMNHCDTYAGIVRSGQVIKAAGDIMVIGDVNPNGKVEAAGNIYILGNFRGIAHAGINGNKEAIIAASKFAPTHVLIADQIEVKTNEKPIVIEHSEQLFAYINREGKISFDRLQEVRNIRPLIAKKGGS